MNRCASCGSPTEATGFCFFCKSGLSDKGISSPATLERLPDEERRVMMLPIAQGIAERLQHRPALNVVTR